KPSTGQHTVRTTFTAKINTKNPQNQNQFQMPNIAPFCAIMHRCYKTTHKPHHATHQLPIKFLSSSYQVPVKFEVGKSTAITVVPTALRY
ncbi:MAG: hypothetical protein J6R32_05880, partial [Bacteroidales bacterium]|nr:hypothetical protein [Bacteroidales bacterium]